MTHSFPVKTFFDDLQVIHQGARFDAAAFHHILLVDDQHIGALLVITDRLLGHQQSRPSSSTGTRTRAYNPGRIFPSGLGKTPRSSKVPVVGVRLMAAKSSCP